MSAILADSLPTDTQPASPRLHLAFLDGLRGLAALYVVLYHIYQYHFGVVLRHEGVELPRTLIHLTNWLAFGQEAVCVFIVLSGYCLMLPVAQTAAGELRGGMFAFFRRRARRILPPYYAALGLSLLVIAFVPGFLHVSGRQSDILLPAFTSGVLFSHFLLIQNWSNAWAWKIDSPMWSVATEWQIYFLFPLILLPIWRKLGITSTVVTGFVLGYGALLMSHGHLDRACPQFAGLFAMGMAGAVIGFARYPVPLSLSTKSGLGLILLFTVFCLLTSYGTGWLRSEAFVIDPFVGLITTLLLIYCTSHLVGAHEGYISPILRVLQVKPLVFLGRFSYSLYLVHYIVLVGLDQMIAPLRLTTEPTLFVMMALGIPCSLAFAYLFHLAFERPFISTTKSTPSPVNQVPLS